MLYIGHGGAEKYFSEKDIKQFGPIKTAVILIGCASARQYKQEKYKRLTELNGVSADYLKAKSPFLMGNLWSVTDKDIDKITRKVLNEIILFVNGDKKYRERNFDLGHVIHMAKWNCHFKFLNGSAVTTYGTWIKNSLEV